MHICFYICQTLENESVTFLQITVNYIFNKKEAIFLIFIFFDFTHHVSQKDQILSEGTEGKCNNKAQSSFSDS